MSNILKGLNPEQKKAVETIDGALQIIAGAGTGKTLVLTHRIAYLIEKGIPPYKILALTFTNKAANEMKERIARLVNPQDAERIWAGTFHSIFARILKIEAEHLGYTNNFTIYDDDDSLKLIKQIAEFKDLKDQKIQAKNVYSIISAQKNKLISPEAFLETATTPLYKQVAEIYRAYQNALHRNNAMDFDDLLVNTVLLFKNKEILAKYQEKFNYILVDEYQDTNRVQYLAIRALAQQHQNICVVGDDAQSIYKWRGADIKNILDFEKDYPNCKTVKLEQNYRSTANILKAADSVIAKNTMQLRKTLWTKGNAGEKVKLMRLSDEKAEANRIITIIKEKLLVEGKKISDFAVLYRTNAQSMSFEKVCRIHNIPYVVVGSVSFYKRKEVKDVLAYLRLLVNPYDAVSFYRVINEPPRGIGAKTVEKIEALQAENPETDIINVAIDAINNAQLNGKIAEAASKLIGTILEYKKILVESNNVQEDDVFNYIEKTGLLDYYREIDDEQSSDRLNNIEQLLNDITSYMVLSPENTLASYLEQVTLISDIDTKEKSMQDEVLTLMTLHSSKGLEFDTVFIPGVEMGLFPLLRNMELEEEEEERRLFYVGITRAKRELFLSYVETRVKFGHFEKAAPSMFLKEVSPEVMVDLTGNTFLIPKPKFDDLKDMEQGFSDDSKFIFDDLNYQENYSQISNDKQGFNKGDIVQHKKFGTGRIVDVSGTGENTKVTVNFSLFGQKHLLVKYANLQKL